MFLERISVGGETGRNEFSIFVHNFTKTTKVVTTSLPFSRLPDTSPLNLPP